MSLRERKRLQRGRGNPKDPGLDRTRPSETGEARRADGDGGVLTLTHTNAGTGTDLTVVCLIGRLNDSCLEGGVGIDGRTRLGGGLSWGDFLQRPEGKKEGKRDAAAKEKEGARRNGRIEESARSGGSRVGAERWMLWVDKVPRKNRKVT